MGHFVEGTLFEEAELCLLIMEAGEDGGGIVDGRLELLDDEILTEAIETDGYTEDSKAVDFFVCLVSVFSNLFA